MDITPIRYHGWSDRLAMDIALVLEKSGDPIQDVLTRHNITIDQLGCFNSDSVFLRKVQLLREEIRDKGMTFRLKARAQAEELLTTSWTLIHSTDVSASVKADLIKSTVKWGGLEPKADAVIEGAGGGVTIQINLNETPALTTKVEPKVIAHAEQDV